MLLWRFVTFVGPGGRVDVQKAIDRLTEKGSAQFERHVAYLAVSPKDLWNEPQVKKLKNEDPLYEIRFKDQQRATRALGYFNDGQSEFVITLICTHKGTVYQPPDAFQSARKRAQQIQQGLATTATLQIDGENFPQDEG